MASPDYTRFKALSFDIYGTLVDWESSVLTIFKQYALPDSDVIKVFRKHERSIQTSTPSKPYRDIASEAALLTHSELSKLSDRDSQINVPKIDISSWPAFPDTVSAMERLSKFYKLIALSNIDHGSFHSTLEGPLKEVNFNATYIAEDIGSYKPSQQNFKYLLQHVKEEFGVEKGEVLMVAHGLESDHVPLREAGMKPGVWIMRGEEEKLRDYGDVEIGDKFETLGDFADAVEKAFAAWEGKGEGGVEGVGGALRELEDKGLGGS